MIRVGTIKYKNGQKSYPYFHRFTPVEVMTPSTEYGDLGPYVLKDEQGRIMENIWQGAKVYSEVPKTVQTYSRWDPTVIWDHPAEVHVDDNGNLTPAYWAWREKLMNNKYAVRYPVGFHHRNKCLYALWKDEKLDYIDAREKIYFPVYSEMVKKQPKYKQLKQRLKNGENLLIMEVDGPRQESLPYYKKNYGVTDDFIVNNTIEVTPETMTIMLNDEKHPFGHGYCLAMNLLNLGV